MEAIDEKSRKEFEQNDYDNKTKVIVGPIFVKVAIQTIIIDWKGMQMKQEIKDRMEKIRKGEVPKGYKRSKVGIIPNC